MLPGWRVYISPVNDQQGTVIPKLPGRSGRVGLLHTSSGRQEHFACAVPATARSL